MFHFIPELSHKAHMYSCTNIQTVGVEVAASMLYTHEFSLLVWTHAEAASAFLRSQFKFFRTGSLCRRPIYSSVTQTFIKSLNSAGRFLLTDLCRLG